MGLFAHCKISIFPTKRQKPVAPRLLAQASGAQVLVFSIRLLSANIGGDARVSNVFLPSFQSLFEMGMIHSESRRVYFNLIR